MEYVDGLPILEFCDARRLSTADRLRLFLEVCSAVQFAHRHLVVHRDLKPSNILVDAASRPRLLDFGIAKILAPDDASGQTATGVRPMTPRYSSPEQIRGEPIHTSSDVYSLGVLLYELLSGRSPYRTSGSSADMERAVCEEEPERPSAAIARAEPTTTPSATCAISPACAGVLMPNPTVHGSVVYFRTRARFAATSSFAIDLVPVVPAKEM